MNTDILTVAYSRVKDSTVQATILIRSYGASVSYNIELQVTDSSLVQKFIVEGRGRLGNGDIYILKTNVGLDLNVNLNNGIWMKSRFNNDSSLSRILKDKLPKIQKDMEYMEKIKIKTYFDANLPADCNFIVTASLSQDQCWTFKTNYDAASWFVDFGSDMGMDDRIDLRNGSYHIKSHEGITRKFSPDDEFIVVLLNTLNNVPEVAALCSK